MFLSIKVLEYWAWILRVSHLPWRLFILWSHMVFIHHLLFPLKELFFQHLSGPWRFNNNQETWKLVPAKWLLILWRWYISPVWFLFPQLRIMATLICLKTTKYKFASGYDLIFQDKTSFNLYNELHNSKQQYLLGKWKNLLLCILK